MTTNELFVHKPIEVEEKKWKQMYMCGEHRKVDIKSFIQLSDMKLWIP